MFSDEFDLSESDRGVPLSYKKFNLQDHSGISDVALISKMATCTIESPMIVNSILA